MARLLHDKGYKDVWPLLGGFEAWKALGYAVDTVPPS
jgi:rhodanese-related sulfurtransferase